MTHPVLPYDPGTIPTKPSPRPGEKILIELPGMPPFKDPKFSIRNRKHSHHSEFVALRKKAIAMMNGRAWSFGPIALSLVIHSPKEMTRWDLNDYMGGIMDTLDGSSGQTFTYLPIIFEDDCQVVIGDTKWLQSSEPRYNLEITFLAESA